MGDQLAPSFLASSFVWDVCIADYICVVFRCTAPRSELVCTVCMVDVDQRIQETETQMSMILRRSLLIPALIVVAAVAAFVLFF
jgi:hypothetical protein